MIYGVKNWSIGYFSIRKSINSAIITFEFVHGNNMPKVKTPNDTPAAIAAKLFVT